MLTRTGKLTIESAEKGRNANWLILNALWSRDDAMHRLEFCGTELQDDLCITEEAHGKLLECLAEDFGYAPYNIRKVRSRLKGQGYAYLFEVNSGTGEEEVRAE